MNKFWPISDCRVEQITLDGPTHLHIAARSSHRDRCCPDCGRVSRAVHSRYERRLADLPSLGRSVSLHLRVCRFYCRNTDCARQTFVERLPTLASPVARRTCRLAGAQGQTGTTLGGEAGARLLSRLFMPTRADTVLRLIQAMPLPGQPAPRVSGVDDWAKGSSYGPIIVDLERHHVLDLLPDRTAATLADWLRRRPGSEVIARDRSTEHASGITTGAPPAVQVGLWRKVGADGTDLPERGHWCSLGIQIFVLSICVLAAGARPGSKFSAGSIHYRTPRLPTCTNFAPEPFFHAESQARLM